MWQRRFGARKFGNTKTAEGYDSRLEQTVGRNLERRELLGEIRDIRRQQTVVLQDGPREVRITVRIDFVATAVCDGKDFAVEAKGFPTPEWKLKLKLWRKNPPMKLEIWGGTHAYPKLTEVIDA